MKYWTVRYFTMYIFRPSTTSSLINRQLLDVGCHVVFHALISAQAVLVAVLENDNLFVLLLLHVRIFFNAMLW